MRVVIRWSPPDWRPLRWFSLKRWRDTWPLRVPPMAEPVYVGVSEVRQEIHRASPFAAGYGEPGTEVVGTLFNEEFQTPAAPRAEGLCLQEPLREQVYANVVALKIRENQAALQSPSPEVLALCEATRQFCRDVCQLLRILAPEVPDESRGGPGPAQIAVLAYSLWQERGCPEGSSEVDWFRAEQELSLR